MERTPYVRNRRSICGEWPQDEARSMSTLSRLRDMTRAAQTLNCMHMHAPNIWGQLNNTMTARGCIHCIVIRFFYGIGSPVDRSAFAFGKASATSWPARLLSALAGCMHQQQPALCLRSGSGTRPMAKAKGVVHAGLPLASCDGDWTSTVP